MLHFLKGNFKTYKKTPPPLSHSLLVNNNNLIQTELLIVTTQNFILITLKVTIHQHMSNTFL